MPSIGFIREIDLVRTPARAGKPERRGAVGVSHATLWRMVKAKKFPQPVKLSAGVTAWRVEDVRAWLAGKWESGPANMNDLSAAA
nr:AlpA family phage regulatory protein [Massilia sp. TS11]